MGYTVQSRHSVNTSEEIELGAIGSSVSPLCGRCNIVQWGTFEGENFHEFQGFVAICESFLREIWGRGIPW